jgi:rare lipoprotein A
MEVAAFSPMVTRAAAVVLIVLSILSVPVLDASATQRTTSSVARKKVGHASWYGRSFHGRRTTSGELYDMNGMTAASPDLPLGSRVAVTNLHNGRRVVVRVNDRMPPTPGRMIDLSRAAAARLHAIHKGVIRVAMVVLSVPADTEAG